jgi:hypothetical protein
MKKFKGSIKKACEIKKAREGFIWSVLFLAFIVLLSTVI